MSCIPGLRDWSIGLAKDRGLGEMYFDHYTGAFLRLRNQKL